MNGEEEKEQKRKLEKKNETKHQIIEKMRKIGSDTNILKYYTI